METWDKILCHVDVPEPPMRDAEGCPVAIQCRETSGLHELTAQGANAGEEEETRLPSPNNFLLTKHDKFTLEIEIGDYITFVQETLNGERDVAPPDKFLTHYLKYSRSKLPRVHAANADRLGQRDLKAVDKLPQFVLLTATETCSW
jgi:hypothetical protein